MRWHAIAALLLACSDNTGPSPEDQLQGTWQLQGTTSACATFYTFEDDQLATDTVCVQPDGTTALERTAGAFHVATARRAIFWDVATSSCPDLPTEEQVFGYELAGDQLVIKDFVPWSTFARADAAPMPNGAALGCFGADGAFTKQAMP